MLQQDYEEIWHKDTTGACTYQGEFLAGGEACGKPSVMRLTFSDVDPDLDDDDDLGDIYFCQEHRASFFADRVRQDQDSEFFRQHGYSQYFNLVAAIIRIGRRCVKRATAKTNYGDNSPVTTALDNKLREALRELEHWLVATTEPGVSYKSVISNEWLRVNNSKASAPENLYRAFTMGLSAAFEVAIRLDDRRP